MATASIHDVRIAGIAACVPRHTDSNYDYPGLRVDERARLVKSTGIERRHTVINGETTSDLCLTAAERLITDLGWDRGQIDGVVLVTQTPDYPLPATAATLQDRLALPKTSLAFDINLGSSGYPYGLQIVGSLLAAGRLRKALLLVGDVSSRVVSATDRTTAPLFGDAGTATALEAAPGAVMHFDSGTDGSGFESAIVPHGGHRHQATVESLDLVESEPGVSRNRFQLILDGLEIFNFTMREAPKTVRNVLAFAQKSAADVDAFVFHQANAFINDQLGKKLDLPAERVPSSLREYGNTSSASIPLTIVAALRERITSEKMSLVLCGFGVGLSWATAFVETDRIVCPPVLEQ